MDLANNPADTSTSATSSPRPGWTPGPTTSAATAGPAGAEAMSSAGRSSTTTSRSGWRRSGSAPVRDRSSSTATRWAGSSSPGYLLSDRPKPDLAVLASPGLDSALPGWKKGLARVLARVAPTLPIPNGIDGSTLSRDPTVGEKAAADPLNATASTARFGAAGLAEQARVRAGASHGFGIPTLVLHGEDDGLVPVGASAVLEGAPGVERRTYPGLRHELHNEPEGPEILDEVIAWLRERARLPV